MDQFIIFFSFIIIISAVMTIISFNPVHSVFWLVVLFINSSIFLISLGFDFLPLILIIIYVGAITILFLFVIMMLDILQLKKLDFINNIIPIIIIISVNILVQSWWNFSKSTSIFYNNIILEKWNLKILNQLSSLGFLLYVDYSSYFIIISLLLLVGMVGAIILTLELSKLTKRQHLSVQHQRNNSWI